VDLFLKINKRLSVTIVELPYRRV